MMNDKEFLMWIRDRLVYKHSENPSVDYIIRLTNIINNITTASVFEPVAVPLKPFAYHILTHDGLEFLSMTECKLPKHISTPLYSPSQMELVRNSWSKLLNEYLDKVSDIENKYDTLLSDYNEINCV